MKKFLVLIAAICLFCPLVANAGSTITFAWDPAGGEVATGYHVYQSSTDAFTKASTKVCTAILEPTRTCIVKDVPDGLKWYAATAYDSAGNESDFSNSISYNGDTISPIKPPGFKIITTTKTTVVVGQ